MSVCFKIVVDGQPIEGVYTIDGLALTVRSAYGAQRINLGLLKPDRAAKSVLRRIVREATRSAAAPAFAAALAPAALAPAALASAALAPAALAPSAVAPDGDAHPLSLVH